MSAGISAGGKPGSGRGPTASVWERANPDLGVPSLVTILFADLIGSTEYLLKTGLEDGREAIDRALQRVQLRIRQYGGTVARVQGDGVMAIFGAPIPMENHALLACCAARDIRDDFHKLEPLADGALELTEIRVGFHSGHVLTRVQKNDFGAYYDAHSWDVNAAKKIEDLCPANSALLSRETLELAGPAVLATSWGELNLANRRLQIYQLDTISFAHNVDQIVELRHISPFVGREQILERLVEKLDAARSGTGGVVAVCGEAGIGKSRLLYELSKRARTLGNRVEELRANAVQAHTPFAPVKALVLSLLGVAANADDATIIGAVGETELPDQLKPAILEVAGISVEREEWNKLDGSARRRRIFEAVAALLSRVVDQTPCLLLAEDAHQLDSETVDLLISLRRLCAEVRLFIVVTARNVSRDVAQRIAGDILDLTPLSSAATNDLCASLTAGTLIAQSDVERSIHLASGNPLFLQELIRDLRNGAKSRSDATSLGVIGLVQARMSLLSPAAESVVRAASILAGDIDRRILAAIAGVGEIALPPALAELERLDLIDNNDPTTVRFRHEVFVGAVLTTLLRKQAEQLHRAALRAFEAAHVHTPEILERLAHHAELGGEIPSALKHLLAAARLAVRTSSLKTVRAIYDWAKRLKTPTEAMPVLIDIVEASFDALQQSGDAKEYRQALELSLEYFGAEGDDEREGLARAHVALLDWMQVRHLEGRAHAEAALRIANELGSLRLKALAQPCLANIEHALGNLDRAIELHLETVELLEGEHEKSMLGRMIIPSVRSRSFAAWFLAERGRFAEAQAQIDKAEAVLSSIEQPYSRVLLNAARGILAIRRERPHEAVAPLEQARELCMSLKFYVMEPCVSGWLATALVSTGAHESARAIAGHSIDSELYLHGGRYTWIYVLQGLAEAQFACGACEEALATIARAVAIAEESKEPIHVAQARFARGQMRRASGLPDEGRQDVVAALSSAEKHGLDPLAAACRRALANAG